MNCANHTETPAVAYCRTCGKALCENCKRDVTGAIYCEPCLAARLHGVPAEGPAVAVAAAPGAPSPALAGVLGFIPGVGAMYNGQFMKALLHVVIFILLIMGADHLSWVFGFFIPFWILYMAFEAHKTARAHQLGLPAPDFLGLDRLFGIQDNAPPATTAAGGAPQAQDAGLPASGLPTGALVLVVLGVIFLLGNFGVLHWLQMGKLWPLFLIAIGLWIAYQRTVKA